MLKQKTLHATKIFENTVRTHMYMEYITGDDHYHGNDYVYGWLAGLDCIEL